jgi:hypothetical protein
LSYIGGAATEGAMTTSLETFATGINPCQDGSGGPAKIFLCREQDFGVSGRSRELRGRNSTFPGAFLWKEQRLLDTVLW